MPTFEERYTAWIDGQLAGEELTAFERELESHGWPEAERDRAEAHQLGQLLRRHSPERSMPSREFFNHQLLQRIAADAEGVSPRMAETPARETAGWWALPHLAWAAAFCLLLGFTVYQSSRSALPSANFAAQPDAVGAPASVAAQPARLIASQAPRANAVADGAISRIIEAKSGDPSIYPSTVHAEKEGLTVVWLDGLDYLPANYSLQ